MGMHCHYKKHYMVESKECLDALAAYRKSMVVYKKFNTKKKKK